MRVIYDCCVYLDDNITFNEMPCDILIFNVVQAIRAYRRRESFEKNYFEAENKYMGSFFDSLKGIFTPLVWYL